MKDSIESPIDNEPMSNVESTDQKTLDEKEMLFQGTSDLILYLDKIGRITKINKAGIAYSGFSEDESIGQFFWKISGAFSKKNIPKYIKIFKNTFKGKSTERFLSELHEKSGKKHIMEFSTFPIRENKKIKKILVIGNDITEQLETEKKYRLISENTSDLVSLATFSLNPTFTYISPSHKSVLGYTSDDLLGKPFFDFIHPKDKRNLLSLLKKYISATGKELLTGKTAELSETIEYRVRDKSGNLRYLESTTNLMGKEILAVSRDITDRKKAEEALHESEAKYSTLVEQAQDVILIIQDNVFKFVNSSIEKISGYTKKEIIGKPFINFIAPESKKLVAERYIARMAGTKIPSFYGAKILCKDGTIKDVEISAGKIQYNGRYADMAIIRDITKRKNAEEKIQQQNIQLKKLDELKTAFLNITSHELRTPMSAIKGYVQMLLRQTLGDINEEQKNSLDVILRNTNRLDGLIQDILDVSRLESGTMKFISGKTDIKTLVGQTAETMQPFAGRKEITISADIEEGVPNLIVDGERIKQVMMNLVSNAIKFSPDGSIVNVKARKEKNDVLFEVQDFGRGIPKDKQDRVFETFYQVDSGADRKFGGAGIGLAISRGIVISHGGKIWVESKEGKGSTFRFTLPVKSIKDVEDRFKEVNMFLLDEKNGKRKND